ncbi:MAG: nitroreductase family protein, partial [Deltaproteobacteria bacterium]|nr:nitroreductase family protein [Deltaproteobacteria bacterium]
FSTEDCTLAVSHLHLYADSIGLGVCWAGYLYKAINDYPPLFEALGLPSDHLAFGATLIGYPKVRDHRIPPRNPVRVNWR